jgi:NAD-dependent DNA ligase
MEVIIAVNDGIAEQSLSKQSELEEHLMEPINEDSKPAKIKRMKELTALLNRASKAYYAQNEEIMDNFTYDKLYEELEALERETGILLSDSPTAKVGYEAVKELPKERHDTPMLSLGKTKSREELKSWLQGKAALLSWKLDGLTIVLTYREGKLFKAVTRGNGEIGEVITDNARTFRNLPLAIPFKGELILRGEAIITYSDFAEINARIPDTEAKYKNPRNLCSGSVRQLSSEVTAARRVRFYAFSLVSAAVPDSITTLNSTTTVNSTTTQSIASTLDNTITLNSTITQSIASTSDNTITPDRTSAQNRTITPDDASAPDSTTTQYSASTSDYAITPGSTITQINAIKQDSITAQYSTVLHNEGSTLQQDTHHEDLFHNSRQAQLDFLSSQGFDVVPYKLVTPDTIDAAVTSFQESISTFDIPSDGLVLQYDDIAYGRSLGRTAKFPRDSIAFKWQDEIQETTLREIEWSASRTGLINPVAIFDPVELEGTTVTRASVHNISILKGMKLGIGDRITVYKANMIIPQIAENLTGSDTLPIPAACPVCGGHTQLKQLGDVSSLYCTNTDCPAKRIKAFTLFVSRDALNIEGLSEATLEKWIDHGFVKEYADLFHLDRYHDQIIEMEGFGEKSYQNLMSAIEKARHTTLPRLLYALGIANIGTAMAKLICRHFHYQLEAVLEVDSLELSAIDGIGEVIAAAYAAYMADSHNREILNRLLAELDIEQPRLEVPGGTSPIEGKSFVVTGSLTHYPSRNAFKDLIEQKGGKVTGSVTGNTTALVNNDVTSTSSKNKKAKELGIPILTEEEFIKQYLEE